MRAKIVVPPADVERAYNDNIEQYSTPEQVRASHILLKTEGKDDAAVKAKAEDVLKQAKARRRLRRAGEEVLGGRGQREERRRPRLLRPRPDGAGVRHRGVRDGAGPDQRPGEDAVRLPHHQAGRQEDRRPREPLAEVRQQISDQLASSGRRQQAADLAQTLDAEISKPADLDTVAKAQRPDGAGDRASSRATNRFSGSARRRKWRPARSS